MTPLACGSLRAPGPNDSARLRLAARFACVARVRSVGVLVGVVLEPGVAADARGLEALPVRVPALAHEIAPGSRDRDRQPSAVAPVVDGDLRRSVRTPDDRADGARPVRWMGEDVDTAQLL